MVKCSYSHTSKDKNGNIYSKYCNDVVSPEYDNKLCYYHYLNSDSDTFSVESVETLAFSLVQSIRSFIRLFF
jgi:hypothetical protein